MISSSALELPPPGEWRPCPDGGSGAHSPAVTAATLADDPGDFPARCRPDGERQESVVDPDVVLMQQVGSGDEAAFTALVERHQQPLLNFFARMGATTDGDDLVQETFVRLYRYRAQYRPAARFVTFLYHLARHVWADRGRKLGRHRRLVSAYEEECRHTHASVPACDGRSLDIQAALDRLSPKLREVIVLNVYQGLRYQEVAEVLGIPLGTVKSRLNLAIAALKESLQ